MMSNQKYFTGTRSNESAETMADFPKKITIYSHRMDRVFWLIAFTVKTQALTSKFDRNAFIPDF